VKLSLRKVLPNQPYHIPLTVSYVPWEKAISPAPDDQMNTELKGSGWFSSAWLCIWGSFSSVRLPSFLTATHPKHTASYSRVLQLINQWIAEGMDEFSPLLGGSARGPQAQ
jgi:hypothetical protein